MGGKSGTAAVPSLSIRGCEAVPIIVRATIENGSLPGIRFEGAAESAVIELRSHVRCAMRSAGYHLPKAMVRIDVEPGVGRRASGLELPIAAAILAASDQIPISSIADRVLVGDVGLDGDVMPCRGLGLLQVRNQSGRALLSSSRLDGKVLPRHLGASVVLGIDSLSALRGGPQAQARMTAAPVVEPDVDLAEVPISQKAARAIEIACAGGHGLMLTGPDPEFVKRVAARVATCLPEPYADELAEMAALASITADPLKPAALGPRPCITWDADGSSIPSLIGGGRPVAPGALSRASGGALIIENASKMPDTAARMLSQAMRDGSVRLARADGVHLMPADAMVIACTEPGERLPPALGLRPFVCVEVEEAKGYGHRFTSAEIRNRADAARAFAKSVPFRMRAPGEGPEELVARTIADLEWSRPVGAFHVEEALKLTSPSAMGCPAHAAGCPLDELADSKALEAAAPEGRPRAVARDGASR